MFRKVYEKIVGHQAVVSEAVVPEAEVQDLPQQENPQEVEQTAIEQLLGFVEQITINDVSGWAVYQGAEDNHKHFKVLFQGKHYDVDVTFTERLDVKNSLELADSYAGFKVLINNELKELFISQPESLNELCIVVNDLELPHVEGVAIQSAEELNKLKAYQVGLFAQPKDELFENIIIDNNTVKLAVTASDHFKVNLWCKNVTEAEQSKLKCFINGKYVEGRLLDLDAELLTEPALKVFEFEVPGYVWAKNKEKELFIQFGTSEQNITSNKLKVTDHDLEHWLTSCYENKANNNLHTSLLALEHLHFNTEILSSIAEEQSNYFYQLSKNYNLDGYIAQVSLEGNERAAVNNPSELIIWQALKEFNSLYDEDKLEENVADIIKNYALNDEQKVSFVKSVIPLFCRLNRFNNLKMYISENTISQLQDSSNKWELSLVLPFMLEQQSIKNIPYILSKISNAQGWLNVECIDYVVSNLVKDHNLGKIDEVENILYSFLALLDELSTDYWSRLHDNHLINAIINCLPQVERFNCWLKNDIVNKAIQHYALANEFWLKLEHVILDENTKNILLNVKKRVQFIKKSFNQKQLTESESQRLNTALEFLIEFNNREALAAKKEWLITRLTYDEQNETNFTLSDELLYFTKKRTNEKLRFAASPTVYNEKTVENGLLDLRATVTAAFQMSHRSTRYELQKQGLKKYRSFIKADNGTESKAEKLTSLTGVVNELDDWNTGFLGLDLISKSLRYFDRGDFLKVSERVKALLNSSLNNTSPHDKPPLAAINCLLNISAAIELNGKYFKDELIALYDHCYHHLVNHFDHESEILALLTHYQTQDCNLTHDTLVVIYSCNKYLDTRIPTIRDTWLKDLDALNIPYLILVGDGDDTINGDVLSLNVSDTYEDLPAKTLKLFEWVYQNTAYQHVLKIDDDCYLDVNEYFDSMSYRKWHYYGRKIERTLGSMDRKWHQDKSQNTLAIHAIDKSPEPSVYADGGGAYCLSRLAMQSLLSVAETNQGKELIHSSYMEDKLVGDLLTIAGFYVSDEDYYTLIRRRLFGDAAPISIWDNNFYANKNTPTKMMHLDLAQDQLVAKNYSQSNLLYPKKIWPSFSEPKIGLDANQLELLSNNVELAKDHDGVYVIAVMYNEMIMLPHFLNYYRKLGVTCFIITDNASTDGTREYLLKQDDVIVYSADTQYKASHFGVSWQQSMLANHCSGKWALVVDADEFILYPDSETRPLDIYVEELETAGYDAACIYMIDTYPYGDLNEADLTKASPFDVANYFDEKPVMPFRIGRGYYSNATGHTSSLRHRLAPDSSPDLYTSQKFSLFKYMPWVKLSEGLHYVTNITPAPQPIAFAHFKYHAAFKAKIEHEVQRKQHYGNAQEYIKYQELLAELDGHFGDEKVSLSFSNSNELLEEL